MEQVGRIKDGGVLPKGRAAHPATFEEMSYVNKHLSISAERLKDQRILISRIFKNAAYWKNEWNTLCNPLTCGDPFVKLKAIGKTLHTEKKTDIQRMKLMGRILNEWFDVIDLTNYAVKASDIIGNGPERIEENP